MTATLASFADDVQPRPMGSCDRHPTFYAGAHYKIAHVRMESPFDYLHSIRDQMSDALSTAKVEESSFTVGAVVQGRRNIRKRLNDLANGVGLPLTINVVVARIENCRSDATPPTLDVVYSAFSSWSPFLLTRTFETRSIEANDPAAAAGVGAKESFRFVPQAGYNATAKLFGGARTSLATRLGKFDLGGLASPSTVSFDASHSGTHTWKGDWIQSAEWRTGFYYYDAPTESRRLKRACLTTQIVANSAPLGSTNAVLRFGAALGGGHDQSSIPTADLPPGSVSSNPMGEFKTYAGISGRTGRHSFKASYGLQIGQVQTGARIDFVKHIADAAYNFRFLPSHHRPIELDTRFTAGWIQNLRAIPIAERFFGGNSDLEFLLGDSWRIRATPFIRSIPQNRLSRLAPDAPIGGERFVSANFTLGLTTWHRPLMPNQIRTNPDFRQILASELSSAGKTLQSYWISKDPAVPVVLELAPQAVAAVRDIRKTFDSARNAVPDEISDRFSDCDFQVTLAEGFADNLENESNLSKRFIAMSGLVAKNDDGSIDNLTGCITDLRAVLGTDFADSMLERLKTIQDPVRAALGKLDKQAAQAKAGGDMAFIKQTVTTLVDEMNFASISPIAIFDVARIGPQSSDAGGGYRYGIGGGIRFTLLDTIRFDGGYAFNPNPKSWEGRGAAFFSMEIISLFR